MRVGLGLNGFGWTCGMLRPRNRYLNQRGGSRFTWVFLNYGGLKFIFKLVLNKENSQWHAEMLFCFLNKSSVGVCKVGAPLTNLGSLQLMQCFLGFFLAEGMIERFRQRIIK